MTTATLKFLRNNIENIISVYLLVNIIINDTSVL